MEISVVIVTYNNEDTIVSCVRSVLQSIQNRGEVILIDNDSQDATLDELHEIVQECSNVRVVANQENRGYSAAANQGAQLASGTVLVFLNPDTEVYAGGLDRLAAILLDESVGAVGPLSDGVYGDQKARDHWSFVRKATPQFARAIASRFEGQIIETKLLIGFCLGIRRELFLQLGGFDEAMFLGSDDLEFSWRLRIAGYRLLIVKDVLVHHRVGHSFAQLPSDERRRTTLESEDALRRKLQEYYGSLDGLTSEGIWGYPIFEAALRRSDADEPVDIAAAILFTDPAYLRSSLSSVHGIPAVVLFPDVENEHRRHARDFAVSTAQALGAHVVVGGWTTPDEGRVAALDWARIREIPYLITLESCELVDSSLLSSLLTIAESRLADVVRASVVVHWKSPEYLARSNVAVDRVIMVAPGRTAYAGNGDFLGDRSLSLGPDHGSVHDLTLCSSHGFNRVRGTDGNSSKWDSWDADRLTGELHPRIPELILFAERSPMTPELNIAWDDYLGLYGGHDPLHPQRPPLPESTGSVSVVIPLYGGQEDIFLCLQSLEQCLDLIHEVVVVDDCSPDDAASIAASFPFANILRNERNLGFSGSCNRGFAESSGDFVLFLNSDTIVPRSGLFELIRSIQRSGSIGAVGPRSNAVGHHQLTNSTYTVLENIESFAEDFALRDAHDAETDMLVGFCLLARRSVLEEVGTFDERFGVGLFEDNDLCYRILRSGYRLVIANRSFVHHRGGPSLERHDSCAATRFNENQALFLKKWKQDLELGFASHLSGMAPTRLQLCPDRHPDRVLEQVEQLRQQADISLCMIVRNEERVLAACLESARPFFKEIIVVDTGSTDATVEIARSFGALVHAIVWPDSFAAARNESLQYATGKWVMWIDADDTIPFASGETILRAAVSAPTHIAGFVIPVRFTCDDPDFGTSVDHVKVFRNDSRFKFEGRIHEQILPSIRSCGGEVARLPAEILHSGYDTSVEGQSRKRERDKKLLALDLADRPDHPFVLFNIGMTAHFNGDHDEAIEVLRRCLEVSNKDESHVRKTFVLLAVSIRDSRSPSEAMSIVEDGLRCYPDDAELLFQRGMLAMTLGDPALAANSYEQVLRVGRGSHFASADTGIYGFKCLHNLAGALLAVGDYRRARDYYRQAHNQNPRHLASAFELFRSALEFGDLGTAEWCVAAVRELEGNSDNVLAMRRDLELSRSGH